MIAFTRISKWHIANACKVTATIRTNFSFAGPRKLDEIMKVELLKEKSKSEISDIWLSYHESKE